MSNSRVKLLYTYLTVLGFKDAIRALDLMVAEMNSENGF